MRGILGNPALVLSTWLVVLASCAARQTQANSFGPTDDGYGPLVVNAEGGGDLYVAQDGAFAPASYLDGAIVIRLKNRPFQIGTRVQQMNICLNQQPAPEMRTDPRGFKASCLSGPMQGAMEPNSNELLVFSGKTWSDGNTVLMDGATRKAPPLPGYARAYQIDDLVFVADSGMNLARFRGTLHGYVVVYRERTRRNRDIMPIRLIIGDE